MYSLSVFIFLFSIEIISIPRFLHNSSSSFEFKSIPKLISSSPPKKWTLFTISWQLILEFPEGSSWTTYSISAFKYFKTSIRDEIAHSPSTFGIPYKTIFSLVFIADTIRSIALFISLSKKGLYPLM